MKRTGFKRKGKPRFKRVRIDQADKFFSLFIRYRDNWTCTRCLRQFEVGTQGLHNSHFWGRARESTRFDPDNCVAHCHGCHSFFTANPALHYEWKLKRMGQRNFDLLAIRAETRHKKDRTLAAIVWKELYLKEKERYETEEQT
jgi:hypothetical protein